MDADADDDAMKAAEQQPQEEQKEATDDVGAVATDTTKKVATSSSATSPLKTKKSPRKFKFYAVRKSESLKGPAIFVDLEDCSFYLESSTDEGGAAEEGGGKTKAEYKGFNLLSKACDYIDRYLEKQKHPSAASSVKKRKTSPETSSPTKKKSRVSTADTSSGGGKRRSAAADATSALARLNSPDEEDSDDAEEENGNAKISALLAPKGRKQRTQQGQEKWDQMLVELPQFHSKYGHYDAPHEKKDVDFATLMECASTLKKEVDKYNMDPETSHLTSKEYELLDSIGYIDATKLTLQFHRNASLLNRHYLQSGSFVVGRDNRTIYNFLKDITEACQKIKAGEAQPLDGSTDTSASAVAVAEEGEEQTYRKDEGDGGAGDGQKKEKITRIGSHQGVKCRLTQLQYEHLASIGFIQWLEQNPNEALAIASQRRVRGESRAPRKRKARNEESQAKWDEFMKLLPKYHQKHGHYDVLLAVVKEDDEFPNHMVESAFELKNEIEKYHKNPKSSLVTPTEYTLLDAIGYIKAWNMTLRFHRKTTIWKDYFVEHGTFRITSTTNNRVMYEFSRAVTDECKRILAGESTTVTTRAQKDKDSKKNRASLEPSQEQEEKQDDQEGEEGDGDEVNTSGLGSKKKSSTNRKWADKKWFDGADGHLTQMQYQHLESIGLIRWLELNPNERTVMKQHDTKYHDRWEQNYDKLHTFYKEHGRHPKKGEDSALHSWIHRQKRLVYESITEAEDSQKQQQHGIIFTPKQIGKLSMVGISFQVRKTKGMEERAQEWFEYVRQNNGKHPLANIPIGKWAMDQRKKYQVWKETGNPGNLTQDFVDRLAAGGFPWVLKRGRGSSSGRQQVHHYGLDDDW